MSHRNPTKIKGARPSSISSPSVLSPATELKPTSRHRRLLLAEVLYYFALLNNLVLEEREKRGKEMAEDGSEGATRKAFSVLFKRRSKREASAPTAGPSSSPNILDPSKLRSPPTREVSGMKETLAGRGRSRSQSLVLKDLGAAPPPPPPPPPPPSPPPPSHPPSPPSSHSYSHCYSHSYSYSYSYSHSY